MAAQAARLNLRMQKELKVLLTDPPPGATFPSLSAQTSSSSTDGPSLTSIDAQIEGPEGTVYAKGVFNLKIQIPERYPFQPPIVTFATPIYHPNIDNGGRICLDILNLPPKGAWQPSLNISTVLTSIGLLLSEPNPDDGLMHEASREYKYNKQAFDQKARSMTEKYARVGASGMARGWEGTLTLPTLSMELTKGTEFNTSVKSIHDYSVSQKRLCGVSRKLSLESSESDQNRSDGNGVNDLSSNFHLESHREIIGTKQEAKVMLSEHNQNHKDLEVTTKKKLALEPIQVKNGKLALVPIQVKNGNNVIDVRPLQRSSLSEPQRVSKSNSKFWPLRQPALSIDQNLGPKKGNQSTTDRIETTLDKGLLKSLDSSQGTAEDDEKLCSAPQQSVGSNQTLLQPQAVSQNEGEPHTEVAEGHGSSFTSMKHKKLGLAGRKLSLGQLGSYGCLQMDNKENLTPNSSDTLLDLNKDSTSFSSSLEVSEVSSYEGSALKSAYFSCNLSGTEQKRAVQPTGQLDNMNYLNRQLEMQTESSSKSPNLLHDSCYDEVWRPKDCDGKLVEGVKKEEQASSSSQAVIVLDSEDSEEEWGGTARSKLSLARRRLLPGKRKL